MLATEGTARALPATQVFMNEGTTISNIEQGMMNFEGRSNID
jgi:hypothetical protein